MQLYRREDFEKTAIVRALIPKIGAKETAKMLIDGLYVTTFYKVLDELVKAGLGIDELVDMLNNHMLYDARQAQQLIKAGAKPDVLVDKVENLVFHGYIDFFVRIHDKAIAVAEILDS